MQVADWGKWETARSLYDAGKHEEALKELQAHPTEEGQYFYNLGTVSYRLGQTGKAVAYLEKANRLKPHEPAIQQNLRLARNALSQSLGEIQPDPASTWLEAVADRVPIEELRGTLGLLALILMLLWVRAYLKTRKLVASFLQPAGMIGAVGLLLTGTLYLAERAAENHPPAVLLESQPLRSGPGKNYQELGQVRAGTQVRLLELTANSPEPWRQVRFKQDGIAWLPESSFLVIP